MINNILATDIKEHFDNLKKFEQTFTNPQLNKETISIKYIIFVNNKKITLAESDQKLLTA